MLSSIRIVQCFFLQGYYASLCVNYPFLTLNINQTQNLFRFQEDMHNFSLVKLQRLYAYQNMVEFCQQSTGNGLKSAPAFIFSITAFLRSSKSTDFVWQGSFSINVSLFLLFRRYISGYRSLCYRLLGYQGPFSSFLNDIKYVDKVSTSFVPQLIEICP